MFLVSTTFFLSFCSTSGTKRSRENRTFLLFSFFKTQTRSKLQTSFTSLSLFFLAKNNNGSTRHVLLQQGSNIVLTPLFLFCFCVCCVVLYYSLHQNLCPLSHVNKKCVFLHSVYVFVPFWNVSNTVKEKKYDFFFFELPLHVSIWVIIVHLCNISFNGYV